MSEFLLKRVLRISFPKYSCYIVADFCSSNVFETSAKPVTFKALLFCVLETQVFHCGVFLSLFSDRKASYWSDHSYAWWVPNGWSLPERQVLYKDLLQFKLKNTFKKICFVMCLVVRLCSFKKKTVCSFLISLVYLFYFVRKSVSVKACRKTPF